MNTKISTLAIAACSLLTACHNSTTNNNTIPLNPDTNLTPIDLALPSKTLWANINIGALTPADYGAYFMWAQTNDCSTSPCSPQTATSFQQPITQFQNNNDFDPATQHWGETWTTPSHKQILELIDNCNFQPTTMLNSNAQQIFGFAAVSKNNGNSIFIPAAGAKCNNNFYNQNSIAYYWSATPSPNDLQQASYLRIFTDSALISTVYRYYAMPIRPVQLPQ